MRNFERLARKRDRRRFLAMHPLQEWLQPETPRRDFPYFAHWLTIDNRQFDHGKPHCSDGDFPYYTPNTESYNSQNSVGRSYKDADPRVFCVSGPSPGSQVLRLGDEVRLPLTRRDVASEH